MNEDFCVSQCEPDRRTAWQRFIGWLLPVKLAHLPSQDEIPFPLGDGDVIHIDTFTTFTLWERLKILAFGTVASTIRVVTESRPGKTIAVVESYVSTERRERRMLGLEGRSDG